MAIFETINFALADGVLVDEFLATDARFETEFVYQQPGFIRRTIARADADRWQSFVLWSDAGAADAALAHESDVAVAGEHRAMIDASAIDRRRFDVVD